MHTSIPDVIKTVTYFINTGSSFRNKSNNHRSFAASYKSKSHCGTPIEHNQSWFRCFFIIAICIGLLICCTFILMTMNGERKKKKLCQYFTIGYDDTVNINRSKNKVNVDVAGVFLAPYEVLGLLCLPIRL